MVAQMSHEFVDKRKWLTQKDMTDYLAVSQSLPGVIAVNMSILIGYRLYGVWGGIVAALASVMPSLIVLCIVTVAYEAFVTSRIMLGALRGIRGAVVALLFFTGIRLRKESIDGAWGYLICAAALCLIFFLHISPIWILLGGILLGSSLTGFRLYRQKRTGPNNPPDEEEL